ncbi:DUF3515 family protein [Streptosporangiaceae bacterium NEAU-GS5]|nr:DUF3515 family protein [Streptosporangiaceae bacterium NEAU-GS5]
MRSRWALPLVLMASACSGTVRVDPPTPSPEAAAACERLAAALPTTLDGAAREPSEPASPYVAVWGGIALRCGVPRPVSMSPTDQVSDVNGVGWYPDPKRPALFTAIDLDAYVEVTVPGDHPAGGVLVQLADPIKKTLTQTR